MLKATLRIAMLYRPIAIVERGRSIPMLRVAKVTVRIAFATGAAVTFSDRLEVSLDCCICRRCRRTVIFFEGEAEGRCTPTGHTFGRLTGKEVTQNGSVASVVYRVVYWYEPFLDAKYPDKRQPSGRPQWARVRFEIVCPKCVSVKKDSTQNNIVRPYVCSCQQCGCVLYTEQDEQPVLSWADATE